MNGLGDLQDPALLENPYPTYRRLLAQGPTVWDKRLARDPSAKARRAANFSLRGFTSLPLTSGGQP